MASASETRSQSAQLERRITSRIIQRTGRAVRALEVEVVGGRVVVRGSTTRYYRKQLALQAVLEAIGQADTAGVECEIEVGVGSPRPDESVE